MSGIDTKYLVRAARLAAGCIFISMPLAASAATTLPPLRAGFWQSSMVMQMNIKGQPPDNDSTPTVRYNCYDATTFEKAMKLLTSGGMAGCTTDLEGGGGSYTMSIKCPSPVGGAGSIISTGTLTFDGNTSLHVVTNGSSDIPSMQMTSHTVEDAKWLGACPAGVAPGDYGTMVNGAFQKGGNLDSK